MLVCKFNVSKDLKGPTENLDKQLKVHILVTDSGTRLPSSLDPNEEERVQGALLIQKAWMFAWLVHAELTAETARDWPVQARGHPFQVQLSSSVRFLRPTVTRVLCASATGHVHSSREAEPLSEDIALLLLAESHQWQVHSLPLARGNFPFFYFSNTLLAKWLNLWREVIEPQLVHHTLSRDHSFPSLPGLEPSSVVPVQGPPSGSPNGMMTSYPNGGNASLIGLGPRLEIAGLGPPSVSPKGLMTAPPNGRHT
ncbi:hypothetical protein ACRRTK_025049 [Alexandromys fortis]